MTDETAARRAEDTWFTREYPVLLEAATQLERGSAGALSAESIAQATGLNTANTTKSLKALDDAGYLDCAILGPAHRPLGAHVRDITERGRREVGAWPTAASVADQALAVIAERIANAPTPEERSRWEKLRDGVTGAGRDLFVDVLGAVLRQQITGQA